MKKFLSLVFIMGVLCPDSPAQVCELHAELELRTSIVRLDWNMVDNPGKTTYVLLRSRDGKNWSEIVTDKIFRKYSTEDIFDYEDKSLIRGKFFYRLVVLDPQYNPVAFSNMVTINTNTGSEKGVWVIYPNPVQDVLMLSFKGDGYIKGVINVQVQNVSGKTVIQFRAASVNRNLQIPVSNLPPGFYVVRVTVMNEVMMNQKFIKQ